MPYLPHAVLSSSRDLAARIVEVAIHDRGSQYVPRYQIFLSVELTAYPQTKTLHRVRFIGVLSVTAPNGNRLTSTPGVYDELINALLSTSEIGGSLAQASAYLTSRLKHAPVIVQSVGGTWVVSQL